MGHRKTFIDCTKFDCALIIGRIKNDPAWSNAAGKTTIFWAILFALVGDYPTSVADKIIKKNTQQCKVEFVFQQNSRIYKITRIKKLNKSIEVKLEELVDDKFVTRNEKTPTATNAAIKELVKVTFQTLKNSICFFQNDIGELASSDSNARMAICKDALGLQSYQKLEKFAKTKLSELSKEADTYQVTINLLGNPDGDIEKLSLELEQSEILLRANGDDLSNLKKFIFNKKNELKELEGLLSNKSVDFQAKLDTLVHKKTETQIRLTNLNKLIDRNNSKIIDLNRDLANKELKFSELEKELSLLQNKETRLISDVKDDLQKLHQKYLNGNAYISSLKTKIQELSNPLPDSEVCPECAQGITEEYRDTHNRNNQVKLEDYKLKLELASVKLAKLNQKKLSLEKEQQEINNKNNKIVLDEQSKKHLLSEINSAKSNVLNIISTNDQNTKEKDNYEIEIKEIEKQIHSTKELMNKDRDSDLNNRIILVKNEIAKLELGIDQLVEEFGTLKAQQSSIATRQQLKKNDKVKLTEIKNKLASINLEISVHKKLVVAFGTNGIPSMIINTILNDLQIKAKEFLVKLKPNLSLVVTPELDIHFLVENERFDYDQLSGGQKVSFAFALKMGLSYVIQKRLGIDIKFLLLDEVEPNLDKLSVEAYANVIRILQKDFKVFVITHNEFLQDCFSDKIVVENDGISAEARLLVQ